jgi:hypothetical protein
MVKFIIHKYFVTNFMVLRRIGELHVTDLRIQLRKIFCTQKRLLRNVLRGARYAH